MLSFLSRRGSSLSSRDARKRRRADRRAVGKGGAAAGRGADRRLRLAIDQLESRLALSLPGEFSIGGITAGSFLDAPSGAPSGPASVSDQVTVSITGTKGTVRFFHDVAGTLTAGVPDGNDIAAMQIVGASSDFQLTIGGSIRTATPVAYGSDGIIRLGQITADTVIRGIDTVKGSGKDVATTPFVPVPFTSTASPDQVIVAGDQRGLFLFPEKQFVSLTPTAPAAATTFFDDVVDASYDAGTNETTVTLDSSIGTATAGFITLAAYVEPSFVLTSFEGVNFSQGGGLFVDVVEGRAADNVGIAMSGGLSAGGSIIVRNTLDAIVQLGTTSKSRADGRVVIESATEESAIVVSPSSSSTSRNSKFQLSGGSGTFAADVTFLGRFAGVMNLPGGSLGEVVFERGVARAAVLNASVWNQVTSFGDFAGTINQIFFGGVFEDPESVLKLAIRGGNLTKSARLNGSGTILLEVDGAIAKGAKVSSATAVQVFAESLSGTIEAGAAIQGEVYGNVTGARLATGGIAIPGGELDPPVLVGGEIVLLVSGNISNSSFSAGEMLVEVEGSVTKGTSFTGGAAGIGVERNFDGTVDVGVLQFVVGGNVSRASRLTALAVDQYDILGPVGGPSTSALGEFEQVFFVGGRFDGILNATYFQAYSGDLPDGVTAATVIAGGVGKNARLNIGVFGSQYDDEEESEVTQRLEFGGDFKGNLRVLGDLTARLSFLGDVNFIVIGGQVAGQEIIVAGKLSSLTTASYFQPITPASGFFFNADGDLSGTLLAVGGYKTVTPLQPIIS